MLDISPRNPLLSVSSNALTNQTEPRLMNLIQSLFNNEELFAEDYISNWEPLRRRLFRNRQQFGFDSLSLGIGSLNLVTPEGFEMHAPILLFPVKAIRTRKLGIKTKLEAEDDGIFNPALAGWLLREGIVQQIPEHINATNYSQVISDFCHNLQLSLPNIKISKEQAECNSFSWFVNSDYRVLDEFSHRNSLLMDAYKKLPSGLFSALQRFPLYTDFVSSEKFFSNKHVLPTDPSQAVALIHAAQGENILIQGPPGTGKSQTLANIVAHAISEGKKVAVVSSKKAALDSVYQRLEIKNLHELCLKQFDSKDLTNAIASHMRKASLFLEQRKNSEINRHYLSTDITNYLYQLNKRADAYKKVITTERLHRRVQTGFLFPVQVQSIQIPTPEQWEQANHLTSVLLQAITATGWRASLKEHPIFQINPRVFQKQLNPKVLVQQLFKTAPDVVSINHLSDNITLTEFAELLHWRQLYDRLKELDAQNLAFPESKAAKAFRKNYKLLQDVQGKLDAIEHLYPWLKSWLTPGELETALALSKVSKWKRIKPGSKYRYYRKVLRLAAMNFMIPPSDEVILNLARERYQLLEKKQQLSLKPGLGNSIEMNGIVLKAQRLATGKSFSLLKEVVKIHITHKHHEQFTHFRSTAHVLFNQSGEARLSKLIHIAENLNSIMHLLDVLGPVVAQLDIEHPVVYQYLSQCNLICDQAESGVFDYAVLNAAGFAGSYGFANGVMLEKLSEKAHTQYQQWLDWNASDILNTYAESWQQILKITSLSSSSVKQSRRAFRSTYIKAIRALSKENNRKKNHTEAGTFLTENISPLHQPLMPVVITTPIAMASLFRSGCTFDIVIFDEAGITPLEEAFPALAAGKQWIVCGDMMQMAPSKYFKSKQAEDELPETLLEACAQNHQGVLLHHHYRSMQNQLIEYSNANFYNNQLIFIPENIRYTAAKYTICNGVFTDGINETEAQSISTHVRDLLQQCQETSVLIVAMSARQADCIEAFLWKLAEKDPIFFEILDQAFNFTGNLLLRSLEHLQGDEADHVIISLAYSPTSGGVLRAHLGPLIQPGGERRLNVLITRARKQIHWFLSFAPEKIKAGNNPGLIHLRNYLLSINTPSSNHSTFLTPPDPTVLNSCTEFDWLLYYYPEYKRKGYTMNKLSFFDELKEVS